MSFRKQVPLILVVLVLLLAACTSADAKDAKDAAKADTPVAEQGDAMMDEGEEVMADISEKDSTEAMQDDPEAMADKSEDMMATTEPEAGMEETAEMDEPSDTPADEAMPEPAMMDAPVYFDHTFTDARTGQPFKISDFKGKVILVETLAQWCSNCMKQQLQVYDLHQQLGERDDFVSIGLDIDPNEDLQTLQAYVKQNGFTWLYGVAPAEVSREIANLYGNQYLNPPSTPMFIIDKDGAVHELPFGIKSAQELLAALEPHLE